MSLIAVTRSEPVGSDRYIVLLPCKLSPFFDIRQHIEIQFTTDDYLCKLKIYNIFKIKPQYTGDIGKIGKNEDFCLNISLNIKTNLTYQCQSLLDIILKRHIHYIKICIVIYRQ